MKIAITGHRPDKLGYDYNLTSPLIKKIERRIIAVFKEYTPETVITGMALGIDTLAALICINMGIPFIAAIPCKNQWSKWPESSRVLYEKILSNALCTKHMVSEEYYTHYCMEVRNRWMVNQLWHPDDRLLAIWDGSSGGTANCVKYAEKHDKKDIIIRINPLNV